MRNNSNLEQLEAAKNPNTPAVQLVELALTTDKEVKARIASNPNTPPDLLVELAGDFLEEIGRNLALDPILMENPNFIENIFDRLEDWIYCHPETYLPLWYLEKARKHSNYDLRRLVASSEYTPISFLKELSKDSHPLVRADVLSNKNTPTNLLFKALFDRNEFVRENARDRLLLRIPISLNPSHLMISWFKKKLRIFSPELNR